MNSISAGHSALRIPRSALGKRSSFKVSAARVRAGVRKSRNWESRKRKPQGGGWAGVAEQAAEDVGEEVREQGGFLEIIRPPRGAEAGPMLEFGLPVTHALRQAEDPHLLAAIGGGTRG